MRVAIDALGGSLGAFRAWTGQRDRMRCATRALTAETWNWKRRGHQLLAALQPAQRGLELVVDAVELAAQAGDKKQLL